MDASCSERRGAVPVPLNPSDYCMLTSRQAGKLIPFSDDCRSLLLSRYRSRPQLLGSRLNFIVTETLRYSQGCMKTVAVLKSLREQQFNRNSTYSHHFSFKHRTAFLNMDDGKYCQGGFTGFFKCQNVFSSLG